VGNDVLANKPVIINAALTGMVPTKENTPHVPITVEEIAADVEGVAEAGAENGIPTCDPEIYRRLIGTVRSRCPEIIICASCSGRIESDIDARGVSLTFEGDLKPDMASLTCGSMNFPQQASVNAPQTIMELAKRMKDRGIKPEIEVFEPGMINYARYLIRKNLVDEPIYVNILLGNLGTSSATALDLGHMVTLLPEGSMWSAAGIGRYQLTANTLALATGGHVRVGLEDNPYYDWGERSLGRPPATPQQAREMLGLPTRDTSR